MVQDFISKGMAESLRSLAWGFLGSIAVAALHDLIPGMGIRRDRKKEA